jgi:hypothetical protein
VYSEVGCVHRVFVLRVERVYVCFKGVRVCDEGVW